MSSQQSHEFYQVKSVIGKRIVNGQAQYLIYWQNYRVYQSTWQPAHNLEHVSDLLQKFDVHYKNKSLPFILSTYKWIIFRKNHLFYKLNGEYLPKRKQKQVKRELKNNLNMQVRSAIGLNKNQSDPIFSDYQTLASIQITKKTKSPSKQLKKSFKNLKIRMNKSKMKKVQQQQQKTLCQNKKEKEKQSLRNKRYSLRSKNVKMTKTIQSGKKNIKILQDFKVFEKKIEVIKKQDNSQEQDNQFQKDEIQVSNQSLSNDQYSCLSKIQQITIINSSQQKNETIQQIVQIIKPKKQYIDLVERQKQYKPEQKFKFQLLKKQFPQQVKKISLYKKINGDSIFRLQNIYQVQYIDGMLKWMKFDQIYRKHAKEFIQFVENFIQ